MESVLLQYLSPLPSSPSDRLDFLVLILAWLPTVLDLFGESKFSDFSFIRTIRILKVELYSPQHFSDLVSLSSLLTSGLENCQ
jgi:hypothetical protein